MRAPPLLSHLGLASLSGPTLDSASPSQFHPPPHIVSPVPRLSTAVASLTVVFCPLNSRGAAHKPPSFFVVCCQPLSAPAPPSEQPSSLPTSETPSQRHMNPALGSFHRLPQRSDQCQNFHGKFPHLMVWIHFGTRFEFLPSSGFS